MLAGLFHEVLVGLWLLVALTGETLRLYVEMRERNTPRRWALWYAALPLLNVLYTLLDLAAAPALWLRDRVGDGIAVREACYATYQGPDGDANARENARWCDAYSRAVGVLGAILDREDDRDGLVAAAETMHDDIDEMLAGALVAKGIYPPDEREHVDDDGLPVALDWTLADARPDQDVW